MIHKIFAVFDSKVNAFNQPFFARSAGDAMRGFEDIFTQPGPDGQMHPYSRHPADFFLFEIGSFDDDDGTVIPQKLISLSNGANFVEGADSKGASAQAPLKLRARKTK